MGLNSEHAARVVFDIETAPLPDAAEYLEAIDAPSNYGAEAAAKYVERKRAELLDKCALDPDLCQVVAIGWHVEGDPEASCVTSDIEQAVIDDFWRFNAQRHLIGYNCLAFDLPVLVRRSQYLGVKVPPIQLDRFRHPQVTDLIQILSFSGTQRLRGLTFYCKRFGIEVANGVLSASIPELVAAGEWAQIEGHCRADVEKTARLAAKLGLFRL